MASRADLIIKINNDLADGTSITASEHRGVEQTIVDSCKPYVIGYFTVANIGSSLSVTGVNGVLSVATQTLSNTSKFAITFNTPTPLSSANYYVRTFIKGLNFTVAGNDTTLCSPLFANTSTAGFDLYIQEAYVTTQNVTVYFEVIPID